MNCLFCEDERRVAVPDCCQKGYAMAPCPRCCCTHCERVLFDGLCIYGCALQERFSTETAWTAAGDAMHGKAIDARTIAQRNLARRLRAFCDRKALGLRLGLEKRLYFAASFRHLEPKGMQ